VDSLYRYRFSIQQPLLVSEAIKMEAVQNLAPYQQQEFVKHLEQMQLKDSLT
jgi:hypothetical protein